MSKLTVDSLVEHLNRAAEGVLYMSESDYPFEVVRLKITEPLSPSSLLQKLDMAEDTPVEVLSYGEFYDPTAPDPDWYGEQERAEAARYRSLMQLLEDNLTDINIYRLGEIEIDIYILGQADSGEIIGLSTKAMET